MLKILGKAFLDGIEMDCQKLEKTLIGAIENMTMNELLIGLSGNFSLIMETASHTVLVTDNIASFPIYYYWDSASFRIADTEIDTYTLNDATLFEMLCVGFSLSQQTKYSDVFSVPRHSFVIFDKIDCKLEINTYRCLSFSGDSEGDFTLNKFDRILDRFFKTQIPDKSANILLPLSGGLDSRLIAFFLRSRGYENVKCFTYGSEKSKEVEKSREIAKLLKFEWFFIEYDSSLWSSVSRRYKDYFYSFNLESVNHYQDLPAVFCLFQRGVINSSYTVIPGHSLDLLMGTHDIPALMRKVVNASNLWLIKLFIYTKFYSLNNCDNIGRNFGLNRIAIFRRKLAAINKLMKNLLTRYNGVSFGDLIYDLNVENRQVKLIVRSINVYYMNGLKVLLPFWSFELEKFFVGMPTKLKQNRRFQKDYIQHLAKDLSINLGEQTEDSLIGPERTRFHWYLINAVRLVFKDVVFRTKPSLSHDLRWFCLYDDLLDKGYSCRSIYGFNSLKSYQQEFKSKFKTK